MLEEKIKQGGVHRYKNRMEDIGEYRQDSFQNVVFSGVKQI